MSPRAARQRQDPGNHEPAPRHAALREALETRRRALADSLRQQMSVVREERAAAHEEGPLDDNEVSDVDVQEETEMALLQLRQQTLTRIDEALIRLDAGRYGRCADCDDEIAEARLRALPFAVRCLQCEAAQETDRHQRQRLAADRRPVPEWLQGR